MVEIFDRSNIKVGKTIKLSNLIQSSGVTPSNMCMTKRIGIISLYRSFRPQGGISPEALFTAQLELLKGAITNNCFVMGEFNLDVKMELRNYYLYKVLFGLLTNFINENNLVQLVNFETWTRTLNGIRKESTLDHIYTGDATLDNEVTFKIPTFGDHYLIIAQLNISTTKSMASHCKRNWCIKGQESTPYEALLVIAGLLFNFTIVKMRGPNKSLNPKSSYLFSLKNSCLARI